MSRLTILDSYGEFELTDSGKAHILHDLQNFMAVVYDMADIELKQLGYEIDVDSLSSTLIGRHENNDINKLDFCKFKDDITFAFVRGLIALKIRLMKKYLSGAALNDIYYALKSAKERFLLTDGVSYAGKISSPYFLKSGICGITIFPINDDGVVISLNIDFQIKLNSGKDYMRKF